MGIMENAKKHFGDQEVKKIDVPEWSNGKGEPLTIYAKPTTVLDRDWAIKRAGGGIGLKFMAYLLIRMATDADGNKLFTLEDKRDLIQNVDGGVVTRIGNKILNAQSVADMEKNS